ncbi:hypothetical protein B5G33_00570 [Blautia sp. An81]|nr:hypothetical protein B5G33_00570 [Blautia sp. An81]
MSIIDCKCVMDRKQNLKSKVSRNWGRKYLFGWRCGKIMKVLIADDEKDVRFLVSKYLQEINKDIVIAGYASNGEEALEFCRKYKPDIVISDIRMPYMTGLELLEHIKKIDENILCIFISAYTDFAYVQEAIKNGAGGYLLKPIQKEELAECVAKMYGLWKKKKREKGKIKLLETELSKLKKEYLNQWTGEKEENQQRNLSIARAKQYIEENYQQNISLEEVAGNVFLNKNYLSELFHKEVGCSFSQYLTEVRIEKAKLLLRETHMKVKEIADMTGFDNPSYFIQVFKKTQGCTPNEYRIYEMKCRNTKS